MDCKSTAKIYKMSNCHIFSLLISILKFIPAELQPKNLKKFNTILRLLRYSLVIFDTDFYSNPKNTTQNHEIKVVSI